MATYIDFDPNFPVLLEDPQHQPHNAIIMHGPVSLPYVLKPTVMKLPNNGTFNQVDVTLAIAPPFAGTFRLGNNPAAGAHQPSGYTWHNLQQVQNFFIPFIICAIAPPVQNFITVDITITTYDSGIITPITQSFSYNLV